MRILTILAALVLMLTAAVYAAPNVVMQDTTSIAQGGDIAQSASNSAVAGGDDAILYQSNSQSAAGTGDVGQSATNSGAAVGDNLYANQGSIQSAQGETTTQIAANGNIVGNTINPLTVVGDGAVVGQSITQGATSTGTQVVHQTGINDAQVNGGDAWIGQLVQSGAIGESSNQLAQNFAIVNDNAAVGSNAIGQSAILGATVNTLANQIAHNTAQLSNGNGNVAQLTQAGATAFTINQDLQNWASVQGADFFAVGQNNVAGGETDMSVGTSIVQLQTNFVNFDPLADGNRAQHIEAIAFADTVHQTQQNLP